MAMQHVDQSDASQAKQRRRLLIVDDDVDFAESLADILEPRGYELVLAHTADGALQAIDEFDAEVALLDIRLDRSNGIELIPRLKAVRPNILCLAMTAYAAIENAIEALKNGAYDYLRKPLDAHDLLATLDRSFEKLRLEGEKARAEQDLRVRNQQLEDLNERLKQLVASTKSLAVCSQRRELGQQLLEEFARNVEAEGGSFYLRDHDSLILMHSLDPEHAPENLFLPLRGGSPFDLAIRRRAPILIENLGEQADLSSSGWQGYKDGSLLIFPLADASGEIVALISLHNKARPPFTSQDKELGTLLASYGLETLRVTRTVEALSQSEEKYRSILESIDEGYFELNLDGRLTFFNESFARITGCSEDELMALNAPGAPPCPFADQVRGLLEAVRNHQGAGKMLEWQLTRKDGQTKFLELSATFLTDADGQRAGYRSVVRDISERRQAELARQRLAAAIDHSADSIIIANQDGTIEYVNPAFEKTTGYRCEEVTGQDFRLLQKDKGPKPDPDGMAEALARGKTWNGRLLNRKKDGTCYESETTISPIRDNRGEISGFVSINKDMTNEVILEEQLRQAQKMEAIGTLAGGIAHDFNNILQAVVGYSELLLLNSDKQDPYFNGLHEIKRAAKRGAELTRQLLTFSRKIASEKMAYDLNRGIHEARDLLTRIIPKMIEIHLQPAAELDLVHADPGQIQQVLINLAVNAKDAMPDGGRLTITTENVTLDPEYCDLHLLSRPGRYVLLSVADTGHGMDSDTLSHIFEPFFTTKPPGSGTGLGLSMVYGIVKNHDGYIECISSPGQGATFKVLLPAIGEGAGTLASIEEKGLPRGGREAILVVDDEEAVRNYAVKMLSNFGYVVLSAQDGVEALTLYRQKADTIDLVLLDLIMPNMSGKRCLEEILRINPQARVLICTGYTHDASSADILQMGARGFIHKPFVMGELLRAIRAVMDAAGSTGR